MAYLTESPIQFASSYQIDNQPTDLVARTTDAFKQLGIDDQLGVLWVLYTEIGKSITPAAPGAARLHLAEGLLETIRQMSHEDQLRAMRDLADRRNTPISRAYGALSVNTKLALWYQLAVWMEDGSVVPVPQSYQLSMNARRVFEAIQRLEFGQQITVMRNAVVGMGVDPLA